ncbi:hypothetical protein N7445_001218 [Penicillium cf. griseofulvum]|nr:hypothetical protein N7445_001218 [Penicillium cf. griseofulvum]
MTSALTAVIPALLPASISASVADTLAFLIRVKDVPLEVAVVMTAKNLLQEFQSDFGGFSGFSDSGYHSGRKPVSTDGNYGFGGAILGIYRLWLWCGPRPGGRRWQRSPFAPPRTTF